jgi:FlaA1/EpsC-like NDP-sugar epimerase
LNLKSRNTMLVLSDAVLINLAVYFALALRFDGQIPLQYLESSPIVMLLLTFVTIMFFIVLKLYQRIWEYASIKEMLAIMRASTYSMALVWLLIYALDLDGLPRSVYILAWLMIILFVGASRLSWRLFRDLYIKSDSGSLKKVLIVGAGDAGAMLAREIDKNRHLGLKALGFVDDEASKQRNILYGIRVLGTRKDIPRLVRELAIDEVIIAMPSVAGATIREIVDICKQSRVKVKILPGLYQSSNSSLFSHLREVQMEDLLKREAVKSDLNGIAHYLEDKVVLVTGAGGSIGSELCRQLLNINPRQLILVENCENNLFDIEMELKERPSLAQVIPQLLDVRQADKLEALFRQYRPQVVFHAAAYKHVPMMERHPEAAIENNVMGTRNTAEIADRCGVETFILISTDKAVNPTSVMGASKRIAELLIKDINRRSHTRFAAVRFGNVLGSRGSVIPTFMKQIQKGGPVTVTHPEMRRYFMTIPEAVQLVIQAGAMAKGGEIFVLDMGEMVKIHDLARDLIRLAGFEPDKDIQIVYNGIRPGEKLYEELFTDREEMDSTRHERIFISRKEIDDDCLDISKSLGLILKKPIKERSEVLKLIMRMVPEYRGTAGEQERDEMVVG